MNKFFKPGYFPPVLSVLFGTLMGLAGCAPASNSTHEPESPQKYPAAISLLGDSLYAAAPNEALLQKLGQHKTAYEADPEDPDKLIWYGRFTAYSGDYKGAIALYSNGIRLFPEDPRMYRHRGHRYISIRELDKAIEDLEYATELIEGTENEVEPDGMPNAQHIPVSTLHGNIWYHLGLAYYLKHDFGNALRAYEQCRASTQNDDNVVSSTHWLYMIARRMGDPEKAISYLAPIEMEMKVIENHSYHLACQFYKGLVDRPVLEQAQLEGASGDALTYALGNWYLYEGDTTQAIAMFDSLLESPAWASFGYIAAEADLREVGGTRGEE